MSTPPTPSTATPIDAATLAAHPELAVLTLDLPIDDGEPLEFEQERMQITLLLDILTQHWYDRYDWSAGGNMFLYYSAPQARRIIDEVEHAVRPRQAFRGPDVFIVLNVDGTYGRQKWVVWEEDGRYPDVIFEFLSPSTAQNDKTTKKDLYERVFALPSTTGSTPLLRTCCKDGTCTPPVAIKRRLLTLGAGCGVLVCSRGLGPGPVYSNGARLPGYDAMMPRGN